MGKKFKKIHPNKALNSWPLYFKWRVQRATEFCNFSKKYFSVKNKKLLDIGCGIGPLSYVLAKKGAWVSALEIDSKIIKLAKKFTHGQKIDFRLGFNENLPFADNQFDAVYSFDVIEHVRNYSKSLTEMKRCVKNGGCIFIETTPYWSLISGHHLYNFTLLPAQFLPRWLTKWFLMRKKPFKVRRPEDVWSMFLDLNHITINALKELIAKNELLILEENYIFKIPNSSPVKINWIKNLGFLQELIPASYQVALKKVNR